MKEKVPEDHYRCAIAVEEATLVLVFVMLWWANEADNVTDVQPVVPS